MTAAVVALLVIAAIAGVGATIEGTAGRAGLARAAVPLVLLGAAAIVALAAPAAEGVGLASVRVAAVVAAMAGGGALATAAFGLAGATGTTAPSPGSTPGDPDDSVIEEPLRGGLSIGILERAAIAVCILTNFAAGLAVIVAAKGLARYPELRNPSAAEQFIIGTFVSVLWASGCAGVAVAVAR